MDLFEKTISTTTVYEGRIVRVRNDVAELVTGKHVPREVVEHPGGVGIVPLDGDGNVILVRQFRYPMMEQLLEIPAGKLEYGEDPYECAVRELSEETGCTAGKIVSLGAMYPSPGYAEEVLHIYLATDLTEGEMHLDEDEFLHIERMPLETAVKQIMSDEITDGKTIVGILKTNLYLK